MAVEAPASWTGPGTVAWWTIPSGPVIFGHTGSAFLRVLRSTPLLRCEFVAIINLTLKMEDSRLGAFLLHRARVRGAMLFQRTRSMQSSEDGTFDPAIKTRPARG